MCMDLSKLQETVEWQRTRHAAVHGATKSQTQLSGWTTNVFFLKVTILPKAIYRFSTISIISPMVFFTELGQRVVQFVWKYRRVWLDKTILRKKNGAGGIRLPDFRLHYKAVVIKTVWYWHKNRNQWNRIENSELKTMHLWSINLWQRRQDYTMLERESLQQMVLGYWQLHVKKWN